VERAQTQRAQIEQAWEERGMELARVQATSAALAAQRESGAEDLRRLQASVEELQAELRGARAEREKSEQAAARERAEATQLRSRVEEVGRDLLAAQEAAAKSAQSERERLEAEVLELRGQRDALDSKVLG
jgi:predicted nuclease with TOPRIM domain